MLKRIAIAVISLSLMTATAAMADSRGHHGGLHDRRDHHGEHYDGDRHYDRLSAGAYRGPAGDHGHRWRRGEHLPVAYYAPPHIVHDYGAYHLGRPPHGHHWVRVGRDAVLAAITTGIVLDAVYDHF